MFFTSPKRRQGRGSRRHPAHASGSSGWKTKMSDPDMTIGTTCALSVGAAALVAAASVSLVGKTRGVPAHRRLGAMAHVSAAAVRAALPSQRIVVPILAGFLGFLGSFVAGVVITVFIVWLIPPDVPHPTEAYEGFGDALRAMMIFGFGAVMSFIIAIPIGCQIGLRVSSRWENRLRQLPFPALPIS